MRRHFWALIDLAWAIRTASLEHFDRTLCVVSQVIGNALKAGRNVSNHAA
jgi:hypothetical protein